MLSPTYLRDCTDDIVRLYQQLEDDIVRDVARRIAGMNFNISETAEWQIERLREAGVIYTDITGDLAKYTGKSETEIKKLLENSAVKSLEFDDKIYKKAGLLPPPLSSSPMLLQHITAAIEKTSGNFRNLTKTTAIKTQTEFINECDRAYMKVYSGTADYITATKQAVANISKSGISVLYPSGKSDKIDVAVRRAVLTGVSQTGNQLQILRADEMGCDLVEVTAHFDARPSHAEWQGRVYSRSGKHPKYPDFVDSTGYGSGDGLGGWNCRHGFFPFFDGISTRAYTDEQLMERAERTVTYNKQTYTDFDASQLQRKFERTIREQKRELIAYDTLSKETSDESLAASAKIDFANASVRLKQTEKQLDDFLKQTGRDREAARQQVQGFGHSQAQRAIWANKKALEKYSQIHYNKNGNVIITDDWKDRTHPTIKSSYKPYAIIETSTHGQIDRTFYDKDGIIEKQIHSGPHGSPKNHQYGEKGEHAHDFTWIPGKKKPERITRDLTDIERKENSDIL